MNRIDKSDTVVLEFYASIAKASGQMLLAAQNGDWDSLCDAEEQCAKLINRLQVLQSEKAMSEAERQQRISYLKKILADDAAIRHITEPRLRQLEEFLRAAHNSEKLINSYGLSR